MKSNEVTSNFLHDADISVDPLGDAEEMEERMAKKNFAKVGSARPSSLMYSYGPGSVMDLPHFTVMPMGLDDWGRIFARREGEAPSIHAPRLLGAVQILLGRQVESLRPLPWQAKQSTYSREGDDLGIPARVFPQWMRCTGCDRLAPISSFTYHNGRKFRPDQAEFVHENCRGDRAKGTGRGGKRTASCVPARYMLACPAGHLDEFPYDWFVHRGQKCPNAEVPDLRMHENATGRGSGTQIECRSCGATRNMAEAQGTAGRDKLPRCRGRQPHLDGFDNDGKGCSAEPRLMLVGASNLWFPATQAIVDMPLEDEGKEAENALAMLKTAMGPMSDMMLKNTASSGNASTIKSYLVQADGISQEMKRLSEEEIVSLARLYMKPAETEEERKARRENWSPTDLLVPEWRHLQHEPPSERWSHEASGLVLSPRGVAAELELLGVQRVLAVDRLRKVNALLGFTRIDDFERTEGLDRLVPLVRGGKPKWIPATEDRGEGVFIQLDESRVAEWEGRVLESALWRKYREAYLRNYMKRISETASRPEDPFSRMPQPRYWLVHTLSHALIRRMAAYSGYGIPSLSERLYAWDADDEKHRPAAAGMLIMTTASDSDGTLGGLVSLSEPQRLGSIFADALRDMCRCSSDPVCGQRVPEDPEDFLHVASCHCCTMLSETSCERANRFLDRRLLVPLPGECEGEPFANLAFFANVRV